MSQPRAELPEAQEGLHFTADPALLAKSPRRQALGVGARSPGTIQFSPSEGRPYPAPRTFTGVRGTGQLCRVKTGRQHNMIFGIGFVL